MRTIFFAHDQQENPEHRKHVLELSGYVVRLFSNHAALLEAVVQGPAPDLVLIDTLLEGKHGFDSVQDLSRNFPKRTWPILLASQIYRLRAFREEALKSGAQDYLLLPLAPDEFLRRVNQAIAYFVPPQKAASTAG
ncbi:MAG: response regulator [Planctomycetota bacterium]